MILYLFFIIAVLTPVLSNENDLLSPPVITSTACHHINPPVITSTETELFDNVAGVLEDSQAIREEAFVIREEAFSIREEAHDIRDQAYSIIIRANEMREANFESRTELENNLVEAISMIMEELGNQRNRQGGATELYIQEMRNTLQSVVEKMDHIETTIKDIETKVEAMDEKIDTIDKRGKDTTATGNTTRDMLESVELSVNDIKTKVGATDDRIEAVNGKVTSMDEKIDTIDDVCTETAAATTTVKSRLQAWMSEVRLISLYKQAEQTSKHSDSYDVELVVDGQFTFSTVADNARTYTHPANSNANNKLWIKLGGLFRIYKIKIWNIRNCCQERLIGVHVYADSTLLGEVTTTSGTHEFVVSSGRAVYASTITLHQERAALILVLEVQTWGTGPFPTGDLFD